MSNFLFDSYNRLSSVCRLIARLVFAIGVTVAASQLAVGTEPGKAASRWKPIGKDASGKVVYGFDGKPGRVESQERTPADWKLSEIKPRMEECLSSLSSLHVKYRMWTETQPDKVENWEWGCQGLQRFVRSDRTNWEGADRMLWYSFDGTDGYAVYDIEPEYSLAPTVDRSDVRPDRLGFAEHLRTVMGLELPFCDGTLTELLQRSDPAEHGLLTLSQPIRQELSADDSIQYFMGLGTFGTGGAKTSYLVVAAAPHHDCWPALIQVEPNRMRQALQRKDKLSNETWHLKEGEYTLDFRVEKFGLVSDFATQTDRWMPTRVRSGKTLFELTYESVNKPLDRSIFIPSMPFGTRIREVSKRDSRSGSIPTYLVGGAAAEEALSVKVAARNGNALSIDIASRSAANRVVATPVTGWGLKAGFWLCAVVCGAVGLWVWWRRCTG